MTRRRRKHGRRGTNAHEQAALEQRLKQRRASRLLMTLSTPRCFRRYLKLSNHPTRYLRAEIQPWQADDLEALDAAWLKLAGVASRPMCPIRRAYIERPRGHSKTSDMAIQIAWILLAARTPVTGVAAAADREQAALLLKAIQHLRQVNPTLCGDLVFIEGAIRNSRTGSRLDLISSDVGSSYGILPDFVICDELSHWSGPELWYSLLSSAAKKPHCVLAVLTNAGVGRNWAWEVRENAKRSKDWYFSSLDGPHAPWISSQSLDEQRAMLPPAVFERLWMNRWQHSDGEFVSLAEAEACIDPQLSKMDQGAHGIEYIAAIDYAEKHDFTAAIICHHDGSRIVVDRLDVVRPSPRNPTPVAWVEHWIERTVERFPYVRFVLDEYQLLSTYQRFETRISLKRFEFQGGQGNHALAMNLRQLILQRKVAWYPGCGCYPINAESLWSESSPSAFDLALTTGVSRDDLTAELSSLLLRQSHSGRVRIDHQSDGIHHDDRAFVLGAACLELINRPQGTESTLEVLDPTHDGGFAWGSF